MSRCLGLVFAVAVLLAVVLPGCGSGQREWEITVENQGKVPCSFFVTLGADGSSKANLDGVAKGKPVVLIAGSGDTIVHTIKVVCGSEQQTLMPDAKLASGKRYAIVVNMDGKVTTSVSGK
jgi:hypothetical protein